MLLQMFAQIMLVSHLSLSLIDLDISISLFQGTLDLRPNHPDQTNLLGRPILHSHIYRAGTSHLFVLASQLTSSLHVSFSWGSHLRGYGV
ncbi:hypothetical protein EV702DRAFT_1101237 [Suillus placidus]|uniref:Uncharacterized protein n=1 Tax=Suillus placidus TaxID=48579 RepID=A0A9P7D309_9AGAM|nr:hypothetical protein EV702DRAFT_1156944 [Suillus placidus]KAG1767373.1 hypothetical protein EV702DRAFT_1147189 [Suillus placidus]KAG1772924.1 hypothetical protein EV702DRAFT_1131679 [Suillus placidus]KAG1773726.1 hypothetical protein EV702DRAFT_1128749 [Suillus placidus]KAG1774474.1 hypothetical protein EV702DRAFT_1124158 [Suillus placidus]